MAEQQEAHGQHTDDASMEEAAQDVEAGAGDEHAEDDDDQLYGDVYAQEGQEDADYQDDIYDGVAEAGECTAARFYFLCSPLPHLTQFCSAHWYPRTVACASSDEPRNILDSTCIASQKEEAKCSSLHQDG